MPRSTTRARRRRTRLEAERADVIARIESIRKRLRLARHPRDREALIGELEALLKDVANSGHRLWSFEGHLLAGCTGEDRSVMLATIAAVVAPELAGRPPGRVWQRSAERIA